MRTIAIVSPHAQARLELQKIVKEDLQEVKVVGKNSFEEMVVYLKEFNNIDLIICEYLLEGTTGIEMHENLKSLFNKGQINRMYPIMLVQNESQKDLTVPSTIEVIKKPKTEKEKKSFTDKVKRKLETSKLERQSFDLERSMKDVKEEIAKINLDISNIYHTQEKLFEYQKEISKNVQEIHSTTKFKIIPSEKPTIANKFNIPTILGNLISVSFERQPTTTIIIFLTWVSAVAYFFKGDSISTILPLIEGVLK